MVSHRQEISNVYAVPITYRTDNFESPEKILTLPESMYKDLTKRDTHRLIGIKKAPTLESKY